MHHHYQLLTVDDVPTDEAAILTTLSAISDRKLTNDIRLVNYYKELPVIYDARITHCERGVVEMQVSDLQAAAMMIEQETFIKSEHLRHDVIARVLKIKQDKLLVLFTNFQYVLITAERRLAVRVRVSDRYDASFFHNHHLVHGVIEDISFGGISIRAPKGSTMEENVTGIVSISLPNTKLEVTGRLIKVKEDDSSKKYIIEMEVDSRCERQISQFIFSQQSRIIRELKDNILA
jgi:c-di-GMP-binding flagellar brake protein YcgR